MRYLILLFLIFIPILTQAQTIDFLLTADTSILQRGDTLSVDVTVQTPAELTIWGIDAYVQYPGNVFHIPALSDNLVDMGWALETVDPSFDTNGDLWKVQYSKATLSGPGWTISESGVAYRLSFIVGDDAPLGDVTMSFVDDFYMIMDAGFNILPVNPNSLIVTISENSPPNAENDAYEIDEDNQLNVVPEFGVLANDSDIDGDTLQAELVTAPAHGELALGPDGSFTYQPEENYFGEDQFAYAACDSGGLCDTATVIITINPMNDAPVAEPDTFVVDEDYALMINSATGLLANDSDVDGDTLQAELVTAPTHGVLEDLGTDGAFTYQPEENFFGEDQFEYAACDSGGLCDTATVIITINPINDPPQINMDSLSNFTIDVLDTITLELPYYVDDVETDSTEIDWAAGSQNGFLSVSIDSTLKTATIAALCHPETVDQILFIASDSLDSDSATVEVYIRALPGDIIMDCLIDTQDITGIAQHILSLDTLDASQQESADVNIDNLINILDINALIDRLNQHD